MSAAETRRPDRWPNACPTLNRPAPSGCLGVKFCALLDAFQSVPGAQSGEGEGLQPLALNAVQSSSKPKAALHTQHYGERPCETLGEILPETFGETL